MNSGTGTLCVGIMAHVDAGKTTLSEQMLLHTGRIRTRGRVDHGDAFMDNEALERQRGITIFQEQASLSLEGDTKIVLIDTPGHEDFAAQRRRALLVMDLCILVVSCADRIQSGTKTIFREVREAGIPILFFLNKTDQTGADPERILVELRQSLGAEILSADLTDEAAREEIALRDEALLEEHLAGNVPESRYLEVMQVLARDPSVSFCLAGSALQDRGVTEMLRLIPRLYSGQNLSRAEPFSGLVYRVRRQSGQRLAYVRVYSGQLAPRVEVQTISGLQKVHALYEAQGTRLVGLEQCVAGNVAAVTGLTAIPGEWIGCRAEPAPIPKPMMVQALTPQAPLTKQKLLSDLRELEEEEPELCVTPAGDTVQVGLVGKTQQEVLVQLLQNRYGDRVLAGEPRVRYRETILHPVTGIGHYEPLRHYAEVWLRLLPGKPGSGIVFESRVAPNSLDENWQRLIRTHIFEREHPGVLTGSPLTDLRIVLIGGRSHLKHTEGGDFREATCRALRQGLMQAENVLLEPFVTFELTMPPDSVPKVTGDLIGMNAQLEAPEFLSETETVLRGTCRLAAVYEYPERFASVTHGYGRFAMQYSGHGPCRDQQEAVVRSGYVPTEDPGNPCSSVFCSHGAGFPVTWDHVREWAHLAKDMEGIENVAD
ncbi:MAG: TetM/TetW/TetO/TetS family tetracycline resistance ribosomal protection protein [Clostridia bacterium]|nr:TetM/TetW/TetO/TetS family tetracycline resistance ribosomal protection protein [Clostridia bacterium]